MKKPARSPQNYRSRRCHLRVPLFGQRTLRSARPSTRTNGKLDMGHSRKPSQACPCAALLHRDADAGDRPPDGLIIPATDTPGAAAAGVPEYIDLVVNEDPKLQTIFREGLPALDKTSESRFATSSFLQLTKRSRSKSSPRSAKAQPRAMLLSSTRSRA